MILNDTKIQIDISIPNLPPLYLKANRAFVFTGSVADMPEWFQDKIVPITQKSLELGEVHTGWNKRKSLVIRAENGYVIADVGSLIIDLGKNRWQVWQLTTPMWGDADHRSVVDKKAIGDGT